MNATHIALILLLAVGVCPGTTFLLLASETACIQSDYRAVAPMGVDPNVICDAVLGPFPGDSANWTVPAGTFRRTLAVCDPEGLPVTLEIQSSSNGTAKIIDVAGVKTLEMQASGEVIWVFIRLRDTAPSWDPTVRESLILIMAYVAGPNQGPVLL